ncbi:C13 family peptidase [Moraxella haemolytica]|uniref:C13 family peptidase n=1 Tax=Moraxella TaxID=475 RepID=UPI002542CDED|nr:C13 family peptidase [Moraxella sp. ZY171148]WII95695.1 C13 family peptidase [Moraxella sp. ZY171148]
MPLSESSLKFESLPGFFASLYSNILAALKMLVGSTRAFSLVKPTFGQFILFLLTASGSNILFGYLSAHESGYFNEQGLISYLIWPVIILVAGIILAKRTMNYSLLFVPVILWLTADTMLVLSQSAIQFLDIKGLLPSSLYGILPNLFMLLFVWQTASLLWIFAKKLHWQWWERLLMIAGAVALLIVWQKNTADQPIFKVKEVVPTLSEQQFYEQSALLEQKLSAIAKGVKGKSEWYFVGVAGYAEQNVFAKEIEQAHQLFEARFGVKDRALMLINNLYTWDTHPIASRTSLAQSLKNIGTKMNPNEDVLFLTLSSHGAVDESGSILGDLVMTNPPLTLDSIDPVWLRGALDASGIRWRVIVVSSCYSGSFIQALSSPTTAIITASRPDRASFGCSNDADMTYFGRAFFAESMREQTTLTGAFSQARRRIGEREALMGFEPSEPQMVMGAMMQIALPELEKTLFDRTNSLSVKLPKFDHLEIVK